MCWCSLSSRFGGFLCNESGSEQETKVLIMCFLSWGKLMNGSRQCLPVKCDYNLINVAS